MFVGRALPFHDFNIEVLLGFPSEFYFIIAQGNGGGDYSSLLLVLRCSGNSIGFDVMILFGLESLVTIFSSTSCFLAIYCRLFDEQISRVKFCLTSLVSILCC